MTELPTVLAGLRPHREDECPLDEDTVLLTPDELGSDGAAEYTVEEAINYIGFGRLQIFLVLYTGMAWLADAMEMILLSFVGPAAKCTFNLTPDQESLISSIVFLGVFASSYVWGFVADTHGRRVGFMLPALCTLLFGIFSALAPSFLLLLFSRMLVGFGIGGATVVFSLCSEFLPSSSRGFWLVFIEFFWTIGSLIEASLAWLIMPRLEWRVLVLVSAFPFLLLLVAYPFVPESPRFLAMKGHTDAAQRVLTMVARLNGRPLPPGRLAAAHAPNKVVLQHSNRASLLRTGKEGLEGKEELEGKEGLEGPDTQNEVILPPQSCVHTTETPQESAIDGSDAQSSGLLVPSVVAQKRGAASDSKPRGASCTTRKDERSTVVGMVTSLLAHPLRTTTLVLWLVFFASAFSYYGLVLLTTELPVSGSSQGADSACPSNSGTPGLHPPPGAAPPARPGGRRLLSLFVSLPDGRLKSEQGYETHASLHQEVPGPGQAASGQWLPKGPKAPWNGARWHRTPHRAAPQQGAVPGQFQAAPVQTATQQWLPKGMLLQRLSGVRILEAAAAAAAAAAFPANNVSDASNADPFCLPDGRPNISDSTFRDVFVASGAELPGLIAALLLVDRFGRKRVLWWLLLAAGLFLVPLYHSLPEIPTTLLLFGARGAIMGSFSVLWAYTPEVYPTDIRSTGLSLANSWGRVGGFVCPFVAVSLVQSCQRVLSIALFVLIPVLAAVVTAVFAKETQGQSLEEGTVYGDDPVGAASAHAPAQPRFLLCGEDGVSDSDSD